MSKKRRVKDDVLKVLRRTDELLGVRKIIRGVRAFRVERALKELEAEGLVEWDEVAQGWKIKAELTEEEKIELTLRTSRL